MQKKILVTGGAGFIGTHTCRALVESGYIVRSLDIKEPQYPVAGVEYTLGDIRDMSKLRIVLSDIDAVYHFAAMVSVPLCQEQLSNSYSINVLGTSQIIEAVKLEREISSKNIRIIFSSTAAVYGHLGENEKPINESLHAPISFYGAQKLASELALRIAASSLKIPCIVFRFFNVYGPGQASDSPYTGVISIFSNQIKNGGKITIHGSGGQTRDFISVHDIVRANLLSLSVKPDQCDGHPINLGTENATSIKELAETIHQILGKNLSYYEAQQRDVDVLYSLADTSRAKKVLNWQAKQTLYDGLSLMLS